MSGVWSTILEQDMTIPSDGILAPCSGSIYIGGPQLPAEMKALGITAGIVFWSPAGVCNTVDYEFIGSSQSVGFVRGMVNAGTVNIFETVYTSGPGPYKPAMNLTPAALRIITGLPVSFEKPGDPTFLDIAAGSNPYIKAINSATIDVWQSHTSTQTLTIPNCIVDTQWRITPDRICETRILITAPGSGMLPLTTGGLLLPPTFPTIDTSVTGQGPHFTGVAYTNVGAYVPVIGRTLGGPNGLFSWFASPANTNYLSLSATFTLGKP